MSEQTTSVYFLVLAAGIGTRFGGQKQLRLVGGKSVLAWTHRTIMAFDQTGFRTESVLIVTSKNLMRSRIIRDLEEQPNTRVVPGGTSRVNSIRRGIIECEKWAKPDDILVVIDANRPLTPAPVFSRCIAAAAAVGAACPVVPLVDGVSKISNGRLRSGPTRNSLVSVQTPEAFRLKVFQNISSDFKETYPWQGIADLFVNAGVDVATVDGSTLGRKITYPEDIPILEAMLDRASDQG